MCIRTLLDIILPPSQSGILIREETSDTIQQYYLPHRHHSNEALSGFQHPVVHALITANKFEANLHASQLLAALLERRLRSWQCDIILVPIPLAPARFRERGYNQVTAVTNYLPRTIDDHAITAVSALKRRRNTKPQAKLKRDERLKNLQTAFAPARALTSIPPNSFVVILDDVITTGTTLDVARTTLQPHLPAGCTLHTLALAH